jgi:hypothetical protein
MQVRWLPPPLSSPRLPSSGVSHPAIAGKSPIAARRVSFVALQGIVPFWINNAIDSFDEVILLTEEG